MAFRIRVGCSGWNYKSWRGRFYPGHLPARQWLSYYSERFDTVEVNNTFYRLPELATFAGWKQQTPSGFVLSVKASRFLTHMKRLRDPEEPLDRLFTRLAALGSRLGPVLYQLPANFHLDLDRLDTLTLDDFETDFSCIELSKTEPGERLSDADLGAAVEGFLASLKGEERTR